MKLPVYLYGHPVLRKVAEEVDPTYPELRRLIADMFETMYHTEGVGLAAPQVGKSIRLVVIDADAVKEQFPECAGRKMVLINPEIEVLDGPSVSRAEGCLSVPGLSESVPRVEHIVLNWLDENFEEHEEEITGFLARIVQHECDHLEGEIYTDKISAIRKQFIRKKLQAIASGRWQCDYRTVCAPPRRK